MKMMFILGIVLLPFRVYTQNTIHLSGVVFNKETQVAIPKVSIFTKNNKIGTISTTQGKFSIDLPISYINDYLYFISIEYETDSLLISSTNNSLSIQLIPKIYSLKEVYVMPDSTLRTLLQKAYSKISENYPIYPTRYEGFFQNTSSDINGDLIEFIEAILSVYKESYYKKKKSAGQIEILKSRIKRLKNSPIAYIGGAFIPINEDPVLQRSSYIVPEKMKYFHYNFLGIKSLNGQDCYEIQFKPLNKDSDDVRGAMLIDMKTLAYIYFDIKAKYKENAKKIMGIINPIETEKKIFYEQYKEKWYLKQISIKHEYKNIRLSEPLFSSLDFVTTSIQSDSIKPIPVEKRLEYMEPIETKVEAYNPNGWTDSDILVNEKSKQFDFQFSTDEALSVYNRKDSKKKTSFTETIIKIVPRLKLGYGLGFDFSRQLILHQSLIGYKFSKKWNIQWQATEDFFVKNEKYEENKLGVEFQKHINKAGYPLFLGTSLWISDNHFSNKFESIRQQAIIPQLSLSKRTNKFFNFEFFINYPLFIHSNVNSNISYHPQVGINLYLF